MALNYRCANGNNIHIEVFVAKFKDLQTSPILMHSENSVVYALKILALTIREVSSNIVEPVAAFCDTL